MMSWRVIERDLRKQTQKTETHGRPLISTCNHLKGGNDPSVSRSWCTIRLWINVRVFTNVTSCITNGSSERKEYLNMDLTLSSWIKIIDRLSKKLWNCVLKVDGQTSDDGVFVFVDQVKMIEKRLLMISNNRAGKTNKQLSPWHHASQHVLSCSGSWCQHCFSCFTSGLSYLQQADWL